LTHYALENAASQRRSNRQSRVERSAKNPGSLAPSRYTVQFFHPSYSLYPVLAAIHGARPKAVPLGKDFSWPPLQILDEQNWSFNAALTFITTPHAPSGCGYKRAALSELCARQEGVILLDEAYVDFADEDALDLALQFPNVLVTRTFSKAYSLCFLRVGYCIGHPTLIRALDTIRDSYNVNGLAQIAAEAALDSLDYYRKNFKRIVQSRRHLSDALAGFGFRVLPSQTNFIFVEPPRFSAKSWLDKLRERKILVRWFDSPETRSFLRITIGSESEIDTLLEQARKILRK
jgi:histidinol-phosphate aminotransferase